ncbi:hypothetical protein ANO11243_073160 [Dothideomycetidae sp. 11243]|nr:hypothetical protein ANO11243_073160 [fungal sp. No.11243]
MAAPNPHQLLLLADHIKLSLLERQRGISLSLPVSKEETSITRSLASLESGIAALEQQRSDLESRGEDISDLADTLPRLAAQLSSLKADFTSSSSTPLSSQTGKPNDPALKQDFQAAKRTPTKGPKAVRFQAPYRDNEEEADEASRAALFSSTSQPYTDDPASDVSGLDNQQIHAHHSRVMAEQDEQLDNLGHSIRRQRDIGQEMGRELDGQAVLLEELDHGVDRYDAQLRRARTRLERVAKGARDNWSWITIGVLVLVLILLIVGTK